jgi:hypothetical protein
MRSGGAAEGEAVGGAFDAAGGAEAHEGLAERGVASAQAFAQRVAREGLVGL